MPTTTSLTVDERRRWHLWLGACEHQAVLPWVRTAIRLAQAAEDRHEWHALVERYGELDAALTAIERTLGALDPAWAARVSGRFYAEKPDGTPDLARRLR
jgi:hypothetical protein